ncbi:DivIVA domain-containing protein [Eisenibacter elegans]|jgi:cell division initiation protein|uniref:DivIVA domain-containing protein n=1 Tax=Eisenibacter elegans TaxID=997 RepID=UPI000410A197|nr:DivIVA domain-containing protein [Eisenibacter elegans]
MKFSPSDIKHQTFTKKSFGGGYDREEVHAFLMALAQEWEKTSDENKEARIKIEFLEKEIAKLKEVETSLFKTLKTAEDTSANMVEQARKNAELKLKDAQMRSEAILTEARTQAKAIVQKAQDKARNIDAEALDQLKAKEREYHQIELQRDHLVSDLKAMIQETLEKITRLESRDYRQFFTEKAQEIRQQLDERQAFLEPQAEAPINHLDNTAD